MREYDRTMQTPVITGPTPLLRDPWGLSRGKNVTQSACCGVNWAVGWVRRRRKTKDCGVA